MYNYIVWDDYHKQKHQSQEDHITGHSEKLTRYNENDINLYGLFNDVYEEVIYYYSAWLRQSTFF